MNCILNSRSVLAAVFMLVLCAPAVQMALRIAPEPELHGVTAGQKRPRLTWASWFSGRYQQQMNSWFNQDVGFRGCGVKTDNQIGLSVFGEASSKTDNRVILGKRGFLYQRSYVDAYNAIGAATDGQLRRLAQNLKCLQDEMARRGISFVFMISPSKVEVYPEYLPDRYNLRLRRGRPTDYERILPLLRANHVRTVDGHELFLSARRTSSRLLFAPGGVHWNLYGAALVTAKALEVAQAAGGGELAGVSWEPVTENLEPSRGEYELDLADLMNVWRYGVRGWRFPRPALRLTGGAEARRPSVLLVGDSFASIFPILMRETGIFASLDFYYYFNARYSFPGAAKRPIDRDAIEWEGDVFSKDLIVVEINESMIKQAGFGFVEAALAALEERQEGDTRQHGPRGRSDGRPPPHGQEPPRS